MESLFVGSLFFLYLIQSAAASPNVSGTLTRLPLREEVYTGKLVQNVTSTFPSEQPIHINTVSVDLLPTPSSTKKEAITVMEGQALTLSSDHLNYNKGQSNPKEVIYTITKPLPLNEGHLMHVDRPWQEVTTFTQEDIDSMKIVYMSPITKASSNSEIYSFNFKVTYANAKSADSTDQEEKAFIIRVLPKHIVEPHMINLFPEVILSQGSGVQVGHSVFEVAGFDVEEGELQYVVGEGVKHGTLRILYADGNVMQLNTNSKFGPEDVSKGHLTYEHDGSRNLKDSMEVVVTDGHEEVSNRILFTIIPSDDFTRPSRTAAATEPLQVLEGHNLTISVSSLLPPDFKPTPSEDLLLTLIMEPVYGSLLLSVEDDDAIDLIEMDQFGLEDVQEGKLVYHANLEIGSESITEIISFNVSHEGSTTSSFWTSLKQVVQITILPVDNYAPLVIVNGGVVVKEGGQAVIDAEMVSVLDLDSPPERLLVVTEKPPVYGYILYLDSQTGLVVKNPPTFYYQKLLSGEIKYTQSEHQNGEPLSDAMLFHVTDGINMSPASWLNITIKLVNDEAPKFTTSTLKVQRGKEAILSKEIFSVEDLDTEAHHLTVTVLKPPRHGLLRRKKNSLENIFLYEPKLQSGQGFMYDDIVNKLIVYTHDYSSTKEDSIGLMVTDGEFHIDGTVSITIEDKNPPKLTVNKGLILNAGTTQLLTQSELRMEAYDMKEDEITYSLQKLSNTGHLEKRLGSREGVWIPLHSTGDTFTQTDLKESRLRFVHLKEEQTGDAKFIFEVKIGKDVIMSDQVFIIKVKEVEEAIYTQIHFEHSKLSFQEDSGTIHVQIMREGSNLSAESSVWCSTKPSEPVDAAPRSDYVPTAALVTFAPGEIRASCMVTVLEDSQPEETESFLVILDQPQGGILSHPSVLTIVINDNSHSIPIVQFETDKVIIHETDQQIKIPIFRSGDKSGITSVICFTQQGSAKNNEDFLERPLQEMSRVQFPTGADKVECEITLLDDHKFEGNEQFSVHLMDAMQKDGKSALLGRKVTVIVIDDDEDNHSEVSTTPIGLILPAPPVVLSLLNLDSKSDFITDKPIPGYPLVCINSCDQNFPYYNKTARLCTLSAINSSAVHYSWEVAVNLDHHTSKSPFHPITSSLFLADSRSKTLDPLYFGLGFSIRCITEPTGIHNQVGIRLQSAPVTIAISGSLCPAKSSGRMSSPFRASLRYVNVTSSHHPNMVHIQVEVPHHDGMVPLISTRPLHDPRLLLTEVAHRAQHVCSNMHFGKGFLEDTSVIKSNGSDFPYYMDGKMRGNEAVQFYSHLDLKSCLWTFNAWYSMTQLVDLCEGHVTSDFQLSNQGQNHLTLKIPLHVSSVYAGSPSTWTSVEHRTDLEVSFYYPTLLWNRGVETAPLLTAKVQVTRVTADSSGHLVLEFRTTALFRGRYILSHPASEEFRSILKPPSSLNIHLNLQLLWSQGTWDGPQQAWRATSDLTLRDYSGDYTLYLVPCMVLNSAQRFDDSNCSPQPPVAFPLAVSFQQTSRPVPLAYSLNTDFQLTNDEGQFLADPKTGRFQQDTAANASFDRGEKIFGKVLWHPSQDLENAYQLQILRLYACTGRNGHIPTYDPTGDQYGEGPQYGCMEATSHLKHRFLLLDREQPYAVDKSHQEIPFAAYFAEEIEELKQLREYSGVDGFVMKVDALYAAGSGNRWFLQVLYTIGSTRGRGTWDSARSLRLTRSAITAMGNYTQRGTNMKSLQLFEETQEDSGGKVHFMWVALIPITAIGIGIILAVRKQNKSRGLKEEGQELNVVCRNRKIPEWKENVMTPLNGVMWRTMHAPPVPITSRSYVDDGTEV